ncbi:MAG: sensor histidine kinase [Candidatus Acidiferrales bacterium]
METLSFGKDLVFLLLLKVGVAASMAAWLARSRTLRRVLFTEIRDNDEKGRLMLFLMPPLAVGTMLRLVGYPFADLTLEGSFLLGLLGGRVVGPVGGAFVSLPAFFNAEWLAAPVAAAAGLTGGMIRQWIPNKETIWSFGPFTFLGIPRWLARTARDWRLVWEMVPLAALVLLLAGDMALERALPDRWLFGIHLSGPWALLSHLMATMMCVAVPLKIWNNTRTEMKLEQNQQLLLKARMEALSSQINPHFLFNTLNTVSSLIRFDPDMSRVVVIKLSSILRRLLRKQENFVPLREELNFIDDYLDIEVIRFGRDKLQVIKEVDEATLDSFVPSMLLQPIVENCLKHGLSARLGGGEIRIRSRLENGRVMVAVEDNGVGIPSALLPEVYGRGIGITNVQERLRVLYGDDFRFVITSQEGQGTQIRIELPELVPALQASS